MGLIWGGERGRHCSNTEQQEFCSISLISVLIKSEKVKGKYTREALPFNQHFYGINLSFTSFVNCEHACGVLRNPRNIDGEELGGKSFKYDHLSPRKYFTLNEARGRAQMSQGGSRGGGFLPVSG